jgi:hypothetical protein
MLLLTPLALFVVLATRVVVSTTTDQNDAISVPIVKRRRLTGDSGSTLNVVKRDFMRSRNLLDSTQNIGVPLNDAMAFAFAYTAYFGVGKPITYCESFNFSSHCLLYTHFRPTHC